MKRVFVCSPLRGPDGEPSEQNIKLARLLMRAVFEAGHAPFVPHLLYPQVLSESIVDLSRAFAANFKFLYVCDELWIYANDLAGCSNGMRREVEDVEVSCASMPNGQVERPWPTLVWMPPEFAVVKELFERELLNTTQRIAHCVKCGRYTGLNSQELCLPCFSGGTPA